jgi:hypothetical protein
LKGRFIQLFHSSRFKNATKFAFDLLNTNSRLISYLIFEKTLKPVGIVLLADYCIYTIIGTGDFSI